MDESNRSAPALAAHRRRCSGLRARLPMKSNPYIGSFRHAPPISGRRARDLLGQRNCRNGILRGRVYAPSSLQRKNSPYIGWFRHSPPSRLPNKLGDYQDGSSIIGTITDQFDAHNYKLKLLGLSVSACRYPSKGRDYQVFTSGRLPGGSPPSFEDEFFPPLTWLDRNVSESLRQSLQETSTVSTSTTIKVLTKLASWFLFPLAHDAVDYPLFFDDLNKQSDSDPKKQLFAKLFPMATFNRILYGDLGTQNPEVVNNDDDSRCSSLFQEDENGDEDDLSGVSEISDDLLEGLSMSSLTGAYYTHQANKGQQTDTDPLLFYGEGHNRLDYVVTQMDIARMARTASRHLDVESILNLPTLTYRSESPPPPQQVPSDSDHKRTEEGGWSWMMVHTQPAPNAPSVSSSCEQKQQSPLATPKDTQQEEQHICVICLEHFLDGDRLRVLPCDHLFHTGCIDRWLSGTCSDDDCYTSGCPTCKKHPELQEPPSPDGSVPSWAFTRLGDALSRDSLCLDASNKHKSR